MKEYVDTCIAIGGPWDGKGAHAPLDHLRIVAGHGPNAVTHIYNRMELAGGDKVFSFWVWAALDPDAAIELIFKNYNPGGQK